MKKSRPNISIADLRHEHDIAQLKQTIQSLTDELQLCRSQLTLANTQIAYQGHTIDNLRRDVADWEMRYSELLDRCESMQHSLYVYEEHTGSEEDLRIDAAIAELMEMTDHKGHPLISMGRQWWGIYRILVDEHGYPASHTQFVKRMTARGMDNVRVPLKLSSLKAIAGTIFERPFEHWPAHAHKVPPATYHRHYDVANMLRTLMDEGGER